MSARRYSYPRFLNGESIRLLKLSGSQSCHDGVGTVSHGRSASAATEPLCLEMKEFPMSFAPSYRALSYAWDPPEDPKTPPYAHSDGKSIVLEQEVHDVTPNLYDAITQMRASYQDSYFWVDALCINQHDIDERQVHVAIMDKIYRNAEEVIVWLGKTKEGSAEVFELVHKIADMDQSFFHTFGSEAAPEELSNHGFPDISSSVWGRYLDLYELRWFSRGWVIQEVVLARRPVAHWGPLKISFNVLLSGSRIFLPERLRKGFFAQMRDLKDMDSMPVGRNAYRISLIKEACIHEGAGSLLVVEICTGTHGLKSAEHIMVHLMRMSRDFHWGDPRDRVYSLLGLVNFTARLHGLPPLNLTPDYGKTSTAATVLTAAATAIIKESEYLGIIAQVSDPSFRKTKDLPSWVPDFFRSPNFAMGRRNLFNACNHQPGDQLQFSFSKSCLSVMGTRIGISRATHDLGLFNKIEDVFSMLAVAYKSHLPLGEDRADVLWRTLIWDIYGHAQETDGHPAPSSLEDSFVSWVYSLVARHASRIQPAEVSRHLHRLQQVVPWPSINGGIDQKDNLLGTAKLKSALGLALHGSQDDDVRELPLDPRQCDPERFSSHASGVIWCQQLFFTDTGYLGMGPKSGEEGDEVWVIAGCPFPMILRRHSHDRASYFVLGRAYVHGVMHGEAVREDSVREQICLE